MSPMSAIGQGTLPVTTMVDLPYGHQLPPTVDLTQMDHYAGVSSGGGGGGGSEHYERMNLLEH